MSCSLSRLRIYDLRINGRIPKPPLGVNQLNQLNQLHNYTAPDVNMLHIAESSAENNKIKGTPLKTRCMIALTEGDTFKKYFYVCLDKHQAQLGRGFIQQLFIIGCYA